jgi:hypothetical protein
VRLGVGGARVIVAGREGPDNMPMMIGRLADVINGLATKERENTSIQIYYFN